LLYLYFPRVVLNVFRIVRDVVCSDRVVILHGRKIGLFALLIGGLILAQVYAVRFIRPDMYYRIDTWYRAGNLGRAEQAALAYLAEHPRDERMLDMLVRIYVAGKRYEIARQTLLRIRNLNPERAASVDAYIEKLSTEPVSGYRR